MKLTPGRLRILRLLCAQDSYAMPDGRLVGAYNDGRPASLKPDWRPLLDHHGYIEQTRAPDGSDVLYVWTITDKGREVVDANA